MQQLTELTSPALGMPPPIPSHDQHPVEDASDAAGGPPAWGQPAPVLKKRSKSVYDTPDEVKIAIGQRLREVREAAGVSLTEAAHAMGYSQPVQLSNMETGVRPVTLRVLIAYALTFDTTVDHLLGLSAEAGTDPASVIQAAIAAAISEDLREVLARVSATSVELCRDVRPTAARSLRLAQAILEAQRVLSEVRAASPAFDADVRGGARLVARLETAAEMAIDLMATVDTLQAKGKGGLLGSALAAAMKAEGRDVRELEALLARPRPPSVTALLAALPEHEVEPDEGGHVTAKVDGHES
jgi:transcriptional regulator with XRE-family HTH domain